MTWMVTWRTTWAHWMSSGWSTRWEPRVEWWTRSPTPWRSWPSEMCQSYAWWCTIAVLLYRRQEYLYKWQMFILRSYSYLTKLAQMAEWIRRETTNQGIGGSIPLGRQFFFHLLKFFSRTVFWGCGGQRLIEKLVIDILMSAQHRSTYFHRKLRCWQMLR